MKLTSANTPIHAVSADWLILPIWEDGLSGPASQLDKQLKGKLSRCWEAKDFTGKPNELLPLLEVEGLAASRLLLVGLGKKAVAERWAFIRAATTAAKFICSKKRGRIAVELPNGLQGYSEADYLLAFAAGVTRGCYGPGIRLSEPVRFEPTEIVFLASESEAVQLAVRRADIEGRAVKLARDLVNEPPCDLYPESFAQRVTQACHSLGIGCTVLDEGLIEQERMGCLLGVARGSVRPPRVVVMRYEKGKSDQTLGLIGKGVTFDSGGLSLKTNEQMLDMKCDMAGAAAVFAAMTAIAELQLPVNALGILALVENLPSGEAMKLGDVLKARNGKTVEVLNTDAEGRLILADVLSYAVDQKATHLVDLATLTGSCMIALGTEVAGLMANNQPWANRVRASIDQAGERVWQLPMFGDYAEQLKSPVADIKNVGSKFAGAITAAKFLENFVGQTPWAHLDIAGPAFVAEDKPTQDAGGTGCFVRSLVELASRSE